MNTTFNVVLIGFRIALIIFNFILFNIWGKVGGDAAVFTFVGIVAISLLIVIPWSQLFMEEQRKE